MCGWEAKAAWLSINGAQVWILFAERLKTERKPIPKHLFFFQRIHKRARTRAPWTRLFHERCVIEKQFNNKKKFNIVIYYEMWVKCPGLVQHLMILKWFAVLCLQANPNSALSALSAYSLFHYKKKIFYVVFIKVST